MTTTAALEEGLVKPSTEFPVESYAHDRRRRARERERRVLRGQLPRELRPLLQLGVRPAGRRGRLEKLVETAERFGWNSEATIPGEVASTLPPASEIKTPLEIGSTAIGQFKTLATPLQLASVAQVIAADGVRYPPTLAAGEGGEGRA